MILVLASLHVHSLTLVVYVLVVCVGMLLYVCIKSLKFEGGTVMVMVLRQYFQLSNCEVPAVQ